MQRPALAKLSDGYLRISLPQVRRPRRRRRARLLSLVALGLALLLASAGWARFRPDGVAPRLTTSGVSSTSVAALALPLPAASLPAEPPGPGVLQLGAYLTVIDDINLLANQFGAEFFLWTRWSGPADRNPSDRLAVLNAPSDNDIDRFELLERRQLGNVSWSLYKVRCRVAMPWRLQNYPFDRHNLPIRIGFANPFHQSVVFDVDKVGSAIDPEFLLYDWKISGLQIDASAWSLRSQFGLPLQDSNAIAIQPVVDLSVLIRRRSELALVSSFLGDFLAVVLCILALIIRHSRDDLVLGSIFSAAGNSVFLAQLLPVSALSGFAGQIQIIIYLGIVYVVIADELLDRIFTGATESVVKVLRPLLLPSYVLSTAIAIYLITPSNALS